MDLSIRKKSSAASLLENRAQFCSLIAHKLQPSLDWRDPTLVRDSSTLAPAIWNALSDETRQTYGDALVPFEAASLLNGERNAEIKVQLSRVVAALNRAGIEPLLIKGASHILTDLWPDPSARLVADIDMLIRPDQIETAVTVLEDLAGLRLKERLDPGFVPFSKHLAPIVGAGGVAPIEIHHSIYRKKFGAIAPPDEIWDRAQVINVDRNRAWILSPTDQVLVALMHGFAGSGTYIAPSMHLRDWLDIHFLAERHRSDINWAWIERHLTHIGWGSALEIANGCFELLVDMSPPFTQGTIRARLDAARWIWQVKHPKSIRVTQNLSRISHAIESVKEGGASRQRALRYMADPATYARAMKRLFKPTHR
ncbi:MAG: nucleotidyltransferase family protein [Hyphomicrobiales bacterium]